ncbi:hypothetical protein SXY01_14230 [Staphylococcus xylosus]|nr:hypothetical protein SXY01_14230 [Staphylococcus xylosus]
MLFNKTWLTIQYVPPHGHVHHYVGWKKAREHYLFLDLYLIIIAFMIEQQLSLIFVSNSH